MFENPSPIDRELEALGIHEAAYKQSLAILKTLPESTERAKTIAAEKQALAEVKARIDELKLIAGTAKPEPVTA